MINYSLLLLLAFAAVVSTQNYTVTYPQGTVKGFPYDAGNDTTQLYYGTAEIYLGIPFVKPPVGELRFQKPVVLDKLPGNTTYDATAYKKICPQANADNNTMAEDCLYLNVYTPDTKNSSSYPVMVWIHGGSLESGSASYFRYEGGVRNFVSRGIVVVTIQYRIGLLGFFTTYTDDFPANLGMLDQVEALRWVKNNIKYFGGNPNQITIAGQSAGGASVSAHTLSPLSQNLFQGAIMESGVASTCFEGSLGFTDMSKRRAQAVCNTTDAEWNSKNYTNVKNCLMNADYHVWLPYDNNPLDIMGWKMSQDNYFMPGVPDDLAKKRPNIPVLIGSNLNEWAAFDLSFLDSNTVKLAAFTKTSFEFQFSVMATFLGAEQDNEMLMAEKIYSPTKGIADNDSVEWLKVNDKVFTCAGFTGWISQEAINYLKSNNSNVYLYEYTYYSSVGSHKTSIPGWNPVGHSAEVPFVWVTGGQWTSANNSKSITATDYAMLDWFADAWSNFIKIGNPTPKGEWTALSDADNLQYYQIGANTFTMLDQYRLVDQTFWNGVVPVLSGPLPPDINVAFNTTTAAPAMTTTSPASSTHFFAAVITALFCFLALGLN